MATDRADHSGLQSMDPPLANMEDRPHRHKFGAMITLPQKFIAAADGSNVSGGQHGPYAWNDELQSAPSGLPFVQLVVCEKQ